MRTHLPTAPLLRDFDRDVWCLFGLPVDNLTMDSTKKLLRDMAGREGTSIVMSTVNVNWVVQSLRDSAFRAAVLNSDIVTIDGRPLLWLSKLLGYPMREVVAGSSLIEELNNEKDAQKPLTLFLFGGDDGVAAQAMEKVNTSCGGLRVVGFHSPGFGTVEEMSTEAIITKINAKNPDILLIALGAKKGTQWIERNRRRLNAKIISHLGATINFLAGTVKRAPGWVGQAGLEWLWRIAQEPSLFFRYAGDGLILLGYLISNVYPCLRMAYCQRKITATKSTGAIRVQLSQQIDFPHTLFLNVGSASDKDLTVGAAFRECVSLGKDVVLDLRQVPYCGGQLLAWILLLQKHQYKLGRNMTVGGLESPEKSISGFYDIENLRELFSK